MAEWNADEYLLFEQQRTRPARDLAMRLADLRPRRIVDAGCGPGNSTAVLASLFPQAAILGIDRSPAMIIKAKAQYPELHFATCPLEELEGSYDVIFSNACLQWIPNHRLLIPTLIDQLEEGGTLAVQMPCNREEPLYRIVDEVAGDPKWGFGSSEIEHNETLEPRAYIDILSRCHCRFEVWETRYHHLLPGHQALLEWVRSTKIRPYLARLDSEQKAAFEQEILQKAIPAYPATPRGEIALGFRRLFLTATRL